MSYIETLKRLKTVFEQDQNVNTVVTGDTSQVDSWKKNVFPLVHIVAVDSPFLTTSSAITRYNFEITVVDIRDLNKEEVNDKFWLNDNRHDVWHETRAILRRAEMILRDENDVIQVTSATSATPLSFALQNLLDGWQQTWTIDANEDLLDRCLP